MLSRVRRSAVKKIRKFYKRLRGDHFDNAGAVTDKDFEVMVEGIDRVKPGTFIEIGTGKGYSAEKIFTHLQKHFPHCDFYTIDIFKPHVDAITNKFSNEKHFHAIHGLSVMKEQTTDPARTELKSYSGRQNVLYDLLHDGLKNRKIDIAFIDSRKGSALAEFMLIEKYLSPSGIIFCHDILNGGKGVEVLDHLKQNETRYDFEVLNTGAAGMIRIRLKN